MTMRKMFPQAANRWQTTLLYLLLDVSAWNYGLYISHTISSWPASCYLKSTYRLKGQSYSPNPMYLFYFIFICFTSTLAHSLLPTSALCHFLFLPLPFTSHSQRPPSCWIAEQRLTIRSLTFCATVAAASSTTPQHNIPEHSNVHGSVHYPLLQDEVRSEKHVPLCHKWTMGIKRHPPRIEFQLWLQEGKAALFIHEVWLSTDEVPRRCHLFNCHNTGMSI